MNIEDELRNTIASLQTALASTTAALQWVLEDEEARLDAAGACEEACCETPMIASCRAAVKLAAPLFPPSPTPPTKEDDNG